MLSLVPGGMSYSLPGWLGGEAPDSTLREHGLLDPEGVMVSRERELCLGRLAGVDWRAVGYLLRWGDSCDDVITCWLLNRKHDERVGR